MQHEPKALVTKQKQQSLEGIKTGDEETKWNEVIVLCGFTLKAPMIMGSWWRWHHMTEILIEIPAMVLATWNG